MGLVCTVKSDQYAPVAFQRFYSDNIVALLPLFDGHYSVVWSLNLENYDRMKALELPEFLEELNHVLQRSSINSNTLFNPH